MLGTSDTTNLEAIAGTLLQYLFLGAGLARLFVRRRQWSHWLGLLTLGSLYVVRIAFGVGTWYRFNIDPGLSGRYGLSAAPLLGLALAAGGRSRAVIVGPWACSIILFGLTLWFSLAG